MTLPKESPHLTPHGVTLGGTLDESMAAELLRPLFQGGEATALLVGVRERLAQVLAGRGLVLGPAVIEPAMVYSLSLMDRQLRFDILAAGAESGTEPEAESGAEPGRAGRVVRQGVIRVLGRLACRRQPHECQVSVQLLVGRPDASTYFAYQDAPTGWQVAESARTVLLRQHEHAEALQHRWPEALAAMAQGLDETDIVALCDAALDQVIDPPSGAQRPSGSQAAGAGPNMFSGGEGGA